MPVCNKLLINTYECFDPKLQKNSKNKQPYVHTTQLSTNLWQVYTILIKKYIKCMSVLLHHFKPMFLIKQKPFNGIASQLSSSYMIGNI